LNSLPKPKAGLPANFFDSNVDNNTADTDFSQPGTQTAHKSSGLPANFFDSGAAPSPVVPGCRSISHPRSEGVNTGAFPADAHLGSGGASPPSSSAAPSEQQAGDAPELWSKLPAPRPAATKRKVLFRPQINLELLAASDSDEEDTAAARAAKKAKQAAAGAGAGAGGKPSMLSFLPAPKHAGLQRGGGALGGTRLDTGGSSSTAAGDRAAPQGGRKADAAQAEAAVEPAVLGNEAYRLGGAAAAAAAAGSMDQADQYQQYQQLGGTTGYNLQQPRAGYSAAAVSPAAAAAAGTRAGAGQYLPPEEALLQEALQAEAAKAARRAAGGGSAQLMMPDIHFKEVNADNIKYVDPAQKEAAQGMRAALGTEYAGQLRAQAAPHVGSRLARSKHQIGTLYANAKLKEVEMFENRARGMKSKAETAGKYGW
jgi:proline-rich protein PRCC